MASGFNLSRTSAQTQNQSSARIAMMALIRMARTRPTPAAINALTSGHVPTSSFGNRRLRFR